MPRPWPCDVEFVFNTVLPLASRTINSRAGCSAKRSRRWRSVCWRHSQPNTSVSTITATTTASQMRTYSLLKKGIRMSLTKIYKQNSRSRP